VLEVGDVAPDFALPDAAGVTHTLADRRGSWVLVSFYPADDTPGCTKQACSVRDHWGELTDAGIDVLSISPDDAVSHEAFTAKYDLPHTLLCDPEKTVMTPWGAWGEKVLYGKTVVGVIRCAYLVDPEGVVRKVWKRVRTAQHAQDVLKAHAALVG
jgi:peroxiredoxin Q/BCP